MGRQALEFLATRDKRKPFCLSVSFKAPHVQDGSPIHNGFIYSPFYEQYYQQETIPHSPTSDDDYYLALPETFRFNKRNISNEARVRWKLRFSTDEKFQESVKSYYRLVTGIDDVVKQIVDELKRLKLDKNTIIIFSSDNGYSLGEHGLEGKWFGFNESIRVTTILHDGRNPQKKHNVDDFVLNIDIAPTILDYAGVKIPEVMQGKSMKPLVENAETDWRTAFYYNHLFETNGVYLPKSEGFITKEYKYMRYFNGNNPDEFFYETLYDTRTDFYEVENLGDNAAFAERKAELIKQMKLMRKSLE